MCSCYLTGRPCTCHVGSPMEILALAGMLSVEVEMIDNGPKYPTMDAEALWGLSEVEEALFYGETSPIYRSVAASRDLIGYAHLVI